MTNQTEPQADVFDMSRTVPASGAAPEVEVREKNEPKTKLTRKGISLPTSISFKKVKKYGVPAGMVLLVAIGAVWSFMPGLFSFDGSTSPAPRSVAAQPSFAPADAMRDAGKATLRDAQTTDSDRGRVPDRVTTAAVAAAPAALRAGPESDAPVTAVPPQGVPEVDKGMQMRVVTLEQSMAELQAKLALLEGRRGVDITTGGPSAKAATIAAEKGDAHKTSNAKTPVASRSAKAPSKPIGTTLVNKGFTLNTIYAGQAWIQDSEQVYVVQVGDLVGDMQILSIDPKSRRVMTTKGVIR
ncbi:hypothetical protein [Pseudomonas cedrina]|uniref:hypothetical protein n=1 Tax=Pseudomonas cedrina TaxID=651740 RepID=UPI002780DEE3|nr:hypothetical protein [Pseudomonas cedrina]MDQ0655188.1 hypothetical protein [Pseudomonas cedrina]